MSRRATLASLAVASAVLLGACGSGEASRGSVEDAVRGRLRERETNPLTGGAADAVAECVSSGLFDPDRFSADERNEATSAPDGDLPDADLDQRVTELFRECEAGAGDEVDEGDEGDEG